MRDDGQASNSYGFENLARVPIVGRTARISGTAGRLLASVEHQQRPERRNIRTRSKTTLAAVNTAVTIDSRRRTAGPAKRGDDRTTSVTTTTSQYISNITSSVRSLTMYVIIDALGTIKVYYYYSDPWKSFVSDKFLDFFFF